MPRGIFGRNLFIFRSANCPAMSTDLPFPWSSAPSDMTTLVNAVIALADGVANTIRLARALAETKRTISLDGLPNMIGLLCARTLDLPSEHGRALRGRLLELDRDLAALTVIIAPA